MKTWLAQRHVVDAAVWQPLKSNPGRVALSIVAIALGVALGVAIHLMNRSTLLEVQRATRSLFGDADLSVQGAADGFDEALFPVVARTPGVAAASPVVEASARVAGRRESLNIMGMDFLRAAHMQALSLGTTATNRDRNALAAFDHDAILLSAAAARMLSLQPGDALTLQVGMEPVTLRVTGVLPEDVYSTATGVMDIAAAQWRLGLLGSVTRIDIRLQSGASAQSVRAALAERLPSTLRVTTPSDESDRAAEFSRAYRVNITALALVALFTGAFLVYATQSLAVIRRRRELALLHALGFTPRQQLVAIIVTALILGTIGATLGVLLGTGLAHIGLQAFLDSLASGAMNVTVQVFPLELVGFALLGIAAAIAGSVAPALAAARIPTAQALKSGATIQTTTAHHVYLALLLWIIAAPLLFSPPVRQLPLLGYTAIACILLGAVLLIPSLTRAILSWLPARGVIVYQAALAQLRGVAHTATTSIATMLVSVSLMVAMSIMVASLRGSFADWLTRLWPADIYVQASNAGSVTLLDASTLARLQHLDGIERITPTRMVRAAIIKGTNTDVTLIARTMNAARVEDTLTLERKLEDSAGANLPVWINVALSDTLSLQPGDAMTLRFGGQEFAAQVHGVYRDFASGPGNVTMELSRYRQLTGDDRANTVGVWLRTGVDVESTLNAVREVVGTAVDISLPGEIRARSLRIFDGVFALTYLLLAVAVLIGLFGISVNASAQVLARRAEFGVLRHLGFTQRQIAGMLGIEGGCLGLMGVLAGLIVGAAISLALIHVVGRQSFHWTMELHVPTAMLATLAIAVPLAAAVTSMWSGRAALSHDVVRAVKEDW